MKDYDSFWVEAAAWGPLICASCLLVLERNSVKLISTFNINTNITGLENSYRDASHSDRKASIFASHQLSQTDQGSLGDLGLQNSARMETPSVHEY